MTSNFFDNACTKIQNMAFKTSKMDKISLEYWYNSFLGRLRVDGRGFFTRSQSWKKVRQTRDQDAAHAQKRVTVPLSTIAHQKHQILRHLKHILKFFFFDMYVQKCTVVRFLQPKVAGHNLKLGCGSLFIGVLFKTCCRYKAQIWHRKNMFISHHIC